MARPPAPRLPAPPAPAGTRYIMLNTGRAVLVDEDDYERLNAFIWLESSNGGAYRTNGGSRRISMHVAIMATGTTRPRSHQEALEVDHVNGDRFNNRRGNLRLSEHWQNACNTMRRRTNKSGFKGVSYERRTKRWRVDIWANKKHVFLGRFDDLETAAHTYDNAARRLQGAFACLNFPLPGERSAR